MRRDASEGTRRVALSRPAVGDDEWQAFHDWAFETLNDETTAVLTGLATELRLTGHE